MDEFDNEDINELEARLYGQIHHDKLSEPLPLEQVEQREIAANENDGATNRALSHRYWTCGGPLGPQYQYQVNNTKGQHMRLHQPKVQQLNDRENQTKEVSATSSGRGVDKISLLEDANTIKSTGNACSLNEPDIINKFGKNTQPKLLHRVPTPAPPPPPPTALTIQSTGEKAGSSKMNAMADWMKRHKNPFVNRSNNKVRNSFKGNPKQGPFFKQQQKLEFAKRVEDKKQKSKKAASRSKKGTPDIIDLLSSDDSDADVVVIPIPPTPTYTVEDSDDDDNLPTKTNETTILQQEENALDATDVQMSTSSCFIRPSQQLASQNQSSMSDCAEKRLDNSSRCASPCSIQSSDDFIGHVDRSRLLGTESGMADDEDLLLLTSDMNSLLEAPQHTQMENTEGRADNSFDDGINKASEFATPKTSPATAPCKTDYRVEHTQFRALDVYESESDITDTVYSKGTPKTTVVRQIDTSSDEDITCTTPRTKRMRKRRTSSSNKGSDVNYENTQSSSDNKNDIDSEDESYSGAERTGIPFISRGPAVERKIRKRSRTLSTCQATRSVASSGHMSDGDFIAKLNHLVQGQDETENEAEESDDIEKAPSAREIAEKILGENIENAAVPKDVCRRLNNLINTIDSMEESEKEKRSSKEVVTAKCDISSSDQQTAIVYKTLPNEDTPQIVPYVGDKYPSSSNKTLLKNRAANGSPIYNVVYAQGRTLSGGLGWNTEMRKFYEESWKGEDFILTDVWRKMNPAKHLWRIYAEDRFSKSMKRFNNLKCTNCCEFGHSRSHCRRPRKPLICYMCGESGHQEPRCPNTICLRCGNKTQVFIKGCNSCSFQNRLICPICKIRGHSIDFCPDKWRRYHSTTEPNSFPNSTIVYNQKKYCSICGHRGHLSDMCRGATHFMEYPVIGSLVKSHQKSYNDMVVKSPFGSIGFNLMYEPCQEYKFDMAERTTSEKYYGRFLNAVGMDTLMTRKRHSMLQDADCSSAKKSKRSSKKSDLKKDGEDKAPDQVQEISESGSVDNECFKDATSNTNDTSSVEEVENTIQKDDDIQLNVINPTTSDVSCKFSNFKSPNKIPSPNNTPQTMDSDSNYSFSEHFDDIPSTSTNAPNRQMESNEVLNENVNESAVSLQLSSFEKRPKPREMETLPDFIPLVDSTEGCDDETVENQESVRNDCVRHCGGLSSQFIMAESDEEQQIDDEKVNLSLRLPCEAKIYLDNFHSKYLLSLDGRNFLAKTSKSCDLKARIDFTSIGHVLIIYGLPPNQNKFQQELLMKYRDIADQANQRNVQSTPNVPKRIDVLIRFLRDDINQLLSNLGNANHLFKRLQYVERQQSKSGFKLADKIRRSLNMILIGQAGLQDGNVHLDKLLISLKTLINDFSSEEVTPSQLRSEISAHWKFIFSSYRYDNYQELINIYNKMVSKNRMSKLLNDPLLLGHKLLDTSFTAEQIEKLEQPKQQSDTTNDISEANKRQTIQSPFTPKNSKHNKRKQSTMAGNSPASIASSSGVKSSSSLASVPKTPSTQSIRTDAHMSTAIKTKTTAANSTTLMSISKKQQHKIMPPPPFANPEKCSTVSTAIQQVADKWKSTCDTLLTEISAKPSPRKGNNVRDSKLPSTFWSRESMRYLDECIPIVSSRPELMEKVKRVQNKSKTGQLSYNDYLAVIKLHTALTGK